PTFVQSHSVKGQLVVLECRLRGTPPMQVLWYREEEQILDSDDFRILRKKELCTLVITEAFPEDSGVYKCVALNSYGSVSCASSSLLSPSSSSLLSPSSSTLLSPSSSTSPLTRTVRSSIILTPSSPSATMGKGSATLPANQVGNDAIEIFNYCVIIIMAKILQQLLNISHLYFQILTMLCPIVLVSLPKPILKKTIAPRPSSARSTEEDIQGSKDALIQDLEKKLRSKEARRRTGQKLSYEERMARRLLGPDNATYMFDQELSDSMDQVTSEQCNSVPSVPPKKRFDEKTNEGPAIQEKCYAPRFLQIPPDLTVEEGRFCRIDFKVGGLPTPDVSWYLDGKAIRPDDYHKMLVCEKGLHSFIIEIVTVHHAGVYECVARNRAGESRFSMRLDVIAQEALRPPTFVQKMLNSRALEGDTVRLECKVDASPPPQLFWKKDKDMLRIDPNRMSLYQDGSGRQCLLIERVVKSDAGWYTLSAINEAGMSTCNARLDISSESLYLSVGVHYLRQMFHSMDIKNPWRWAGFSTL
uniref:Ig-like domain-containing protein n=1 Tax=Periophthalmus magnuspinnatus TaxID=409849 RepID=A0A3B4A0R9_9GOBI